MTVEILPTDGTKFDESKTQFYNVFQEGFLTNRATKSFINSLFSEFTIDNTDLKSAYNDLILQDVDAHSLVMAFDIILSLVLKNIMRSPFEIEAAKHYILTGVAEVGTFGATKYGWHNWKYLVNGKQRYWDALLRHLNAFLLGEQKDKETNISHLCHAAWNVFAVKYMLVQEVEMTKRFSVGSKKVD